MYRKKNDDDIEVSAALIGAKKTYVKWF